MGYIGRHINTSMIWKRDRGNEGKIGKSGEGGGREREREKNCIWRNYTPECIHLAVFMSGVGNKCSILLLSYYCLPLSNFFIMNKYCFLKLDKHTNIFLASKSLHPWHLSNNNRNITSLTAYAKLNQLNFFTTDHCPGYLPFSSKHGHH